MSKKNVSEKKVIVSNGIKYYVYKNGLKVCVLDGEEYVFCPLVECEPEVQNAVIGYLKETQPDLFTNESVLYNDILPNYRVKCIWSKGICLTKEQEEMPILEETKKFWVMDDMKSFFDNFNNIVLSPEERKRWKSCMEMYIRDRGHYNAYREILKEDKDFINNWVDYYNMLIEEGEI